MKEQASNSQGSIGEPGYQNARNASGDPRRTLAGPCITIRYRDALNNLLGGDALEVLRGLQTDSAACVVTTLPGPRGYGVPRPYGPGVGRYGLEEGEYVAAVRAVLDEARRLLGWDGAVWLHFDDGDGDGDGDVADRIAAALEGDNWQLWYRATRRGRGRRPRRHQMLFCTRMAAYRLDLTVIGAPGMKARGLTAWRRRVRRRWSALTGPRLVRLPRCIEVVCPPGAAVLDPFSGAGETALAVQRLGGGRRYIGIDLDPARHDLAVERLLTDGTSASGRVTHLVARRAPLAHDTGQGRA